MTAYPDHRPRHDLVDDLRAYVRWRDAFESTLLDARLGVWRPLTIARPTPQADGDDGSNLTAE